MCAQLVGQVFKREVFFHRIVGVWPDEDQFMGSLSWTKGYICLLCIIVNTLLQCSNIFTTVDTIEYVTEVVILLIGTLKILMLILKRDSILELIAMTSEVRKCSEKQHYHYDDDDDEPSNIRNHWQQSYQDLLINFCIKTYLFLAILYILSPFFTDKTLPIEGFLPNAAYDYPWYQMIYLLESVCIILGASAILSNDTFCIAFICQLCSELELVRYSIIKLSDDKTTLGSFIEGHSLVLRYGERICRCYQLAFFLQHIVMSTFICLAGISLFKLQNAITIARIAVISAILALTILIVCLVGEMLANTSLGIAAAIEDDLIDINLGDPPKLRALGLALCRAQRPLRMTVGWNNSINLALFSNTLNKLVSGFMFLRTMIYNTPTLMDKM